MQQELGRSDGNGYPLKMYVRDHQLSPQLVEKVCREAKAIGVQGMEYQYEPISNDIYGYELTLFMSENKKK